MNSDREEIVSRRLPRRGINELFHHKVCINLDRRPERWNRMEREFVRHGIRSVSRFAAFDGNDLRVPAGWNRSPGAYGCLLSHLQVVRDARDSGYESVFIFEDDVVFDADFESKLTSCVEQLPSDWDMLFLGALHRDELIKVTENIGRITNANSTYAYALRNTVFDDFISLNEKALDVLDNNNYVLQQRFNCYCCMPHLAWVEAAYSDAQNRLEHHWYLKESLVLFGPEVNRILNDTTIVFAHQRVEHGRENLLHLIEYFDEYFSPFIDMVIVEQGARPSVSTAELPANCKYVLSRDEGAFDRDCCFQMGIDKSDPRRKYLILSDSDLYLETLDIRANLRMCERYDYVTGFGRVVDLTDEDSRLLRSSKTTRGIDVSKYRPQAGHKRGGIFCCFNREAVSSRGGWSSRLLEEEHQILQSLRVFRSPNHALRLH